MTKASDLKKVFAAGRPLVEQWLAIGEQIAELRKDATERGLDWSAIKALLKAQIQDEEDGGDRVKKLVTKAVEKADYAASYADMLGLTSVNMNKNNFSSDIAKPVEQSKEHAAATAENATVARDTSQSVAIADDGEGAAPPEPDHSSEPDFDTIPDFLRRTPDGAVGAAPAG